MNVVLITVLLGTLLVLVVVLALTLAFQRRVGPDEALVVSTSAAAEPRVAFSSRMVFPLLHRATSVSLREQTLTFERRGETSLRTGTEPIELQATFRLRVSRTAEDVLEVSRAMGDQASDPAAIHARFAPRLEEALETAARATTARAIEEDRSSFKDAVIALAGEDLGGFVLVDLNVTGVSGGAPSPYRG